MDIALIILGSILLLVGVIGCIIPALPGPPIGFGALIALLFHSNSAVHPSSKVLWIIGALVLVVTLLDYVLPLWGTKKFGGSKAGKNGSLIGLIVGLFLGPLGIIFGPFVGAVAGELITGKDTQVALKSGLGSFIGFATGTLLKLGVVIYMAYTFIMYLI